MLSTFIINRILVCAGLALVLSLVSNNHRIVSTQVLNFNAILYISLNLNGWFLTTGLVMRG